MYQRLYCTHAYIYYTHLFIITYILYIALNPKTYNCPSVRAENLQASKLPRPTRISWTRRRPTSRAGAILLRPEHLHGNPHARLPGL